MSYSPEQMYPGAFTPDSNFLGGKFKNSTAPGVYDGTPLDNLLFNQTLALLDAAMIEAGFDYNNTEDTPQDSQLHKALQATRQVEPLNNDYNGYMDPDHQSSLPSDAGYPGNSGSPTTYALDDEISLGIFSGSAGNNVSSDADGWVFDGSIYKEYTMTAEQIALIDVNSVNVFVKDEAGVSYFWKNGDTGVTVSKPTSTTLRVTLSSAIFGVITKLWRFFVTEKVGYVGELGAEVTQKLLTQQPEKYLIVGSDYVPVGDEEGFTIITDPNLPDAVSIRSRYVLTNPFGVNVPVTCEAEVYANSRWAQSGWLHAPDNGGYGTKSSYIGGEGVIVQTGTYRLYWVGDCSGGGHTSSPAGVTPVPCRVWVTKR